jgi:hypothetical protein
VLDFTNDELFNPKKPKKPDKETRFSRKKYDGLDTSDMDKIAQEFIEETCTVIAPDSSDTAPVIIDLGGLMLFLVFGKDEDTGMPDGEIQSAYLAVSMMGQEWIMVPSEHADWIVDRFLDFLSGSMDMFAMLDDINEELDDDEDNPS